MMHDQNCNCHCVPGPQRVSFLTIQLFGIFSSLSLWSVLTGRVAQSSTGVEPFRDDGGVISPGLGEQEQELKKLHAGKAAQQLKTSGSVLFTEGSLFFSKPFDGPKQKPARSCQPSVSRQQPFSQVQAWHCDRPNIHVRLRGAASFECHTTGSRLPNKCRLGSERV